jgi:siroheme synthase (precorrin-2 oxidase/ferrochelatase)
VRRPPMVVAISSSGEAPALARLVREVVEHLLPGADWVEHAKELRVRWAAESTPMKDRFAQLVRDVTAGKPDE